VSEPDADHDPEHEQRGWRIRAEWGPTGAQALRSAGDLTVAVIVDVLSFTTSVTVAVERGVTVFPFAWKDARAAQYAAEVDATLAVGRLEAEREAEREASRAVSLSPATMARLEGIERIVLPSPNGSTIAAMLAGSGVDVVAACLRNAETVARWLATRSAPEDTIAIIAAGERWPDGSLRPAVEDLWGAGAVVAGLVEAGTAPETLSPEARVAEASFRAVRPCLDSELGGCASGRELIAKGFCDDVRIAAEAGASSVVPLLVDGAFRAVGG